MLFRMRFFFFYALKQTICIRKRDATNHFRLVTASVDQSALNELVTQRSVASLTDGAWSDGLPYSLRYSCLLIWLWETFLALGKYFVRKLKYLRLRGSVDRKSFWIVSFYKPKLHNRYLSSNFQCFYKPNVYFTKLCSIYYVWHLDDSL